MIPEENKQLCRLFAEILSYPGEALPESANKCLTQLGGSFPEIAEQMRPFVVFVEGKSRGLLEELYAETFDLAPALTLNIGYHLFGETPKRSAFLVRLEEAYQNHGFQSGPELADHLCVLLRFLSIARDAEFVNPLLEECILPVLDKMVEDFRNNKNGYGPAVSSLKMFLKQISRNLKKVGALEG